ncbi:hypothetical protein NS277_09355 [Novosphingobium barchaimii]|nr:hypothetical protein NS277_09355 [Novosphingobium barchaimii]
MPSTGSSDVAAQIAALLEKPYARFFGFEVLQAEPGAITLALAHRVEFQHAPGFFQGTVTTAMGEIAGSWSAATAAGSEHDTVVLEQSIRFVAAARGDRLIGVGRMIRKGKSISFAATDIFAEHHGERTLCAQLSLTARHSLLRTGGAA